MSDGRSFGPCVRSTAICRGLLASFAGKKFVLNVLSVDRKFIRIGDMVTILTGVAVRVIGAVGSCVVCTKTFGADLGSIAFVVAVSGPAV